MSTILTGRTTRVRELIEDMGDAASVGVRIKTKPKADVLPDTFNARIQRIHRERIAGLKAAVSLTLANGDGQSGRPAVDKGGGQSVPPPDGWTGGGGLEHRIGTVAARGVRDMMEATTVEMGRAQGAVGEVRYHRDQLWGIQDQIRQLMQARKTAIGGDAARMDVAIDVLKSRYDEHAEACGSKTFDIAYPKGPYLYEHVSPDADGSPMVRGSMKDVRELIEYDAGQPRTAPGRTDTAASKSGKPGATTKMKGGKFASIRAKMAGAKAA